MAIELGILGAGNMAEAIAGGVIRAALLKPAEIFASDPSPQRRDVFSDRLGIKAVDDNGQVASTAGMVLLSTKPQQMAGVLSGIADVTRPDALIISIAAGISTAFIERNLGNRAAWRVIRTMPNTPMLIGDGMVALARGQHATAEDARQARKLFECAARVIEVPEDQLDAVTAVSGSGPAYFFFLVEQLIRAAIDLRISPENSRTLAIQTALGAAKMMNASPEAPQELRRKVTSPGGTTQAAIEHMERHNWPQITTDAVKAAAQRSRNLGTQ